MVDRITKLRWRRRVRRSRQQVEDISYSAEDNLEKHVFKRLGKLVNVQRFIFVWILLIVLLIGVTISQTYSLSNYYQSLHPVAGGDYIEGVLGTFSNANPIFATSDVDNTVSRLIFPGLLKYNQKNQLVGDLAQSWSSDSTGQTYTVVLRKDLHWQDGSPLTASDVVFTFNTIQNPNVQSPLYSSWQGVKVTALNNYTIQFVLPDPLSSFPYQLTTGIIPEHILSAVSVDSLRSDNFNTSDLIGSGPFKEQEIQVVNSNPNDYQVAIGLTGNSFYYGGLPKLNSFVVDAFVNQQDMISSFDKRELTAMAGLNSVPSNLVNNSGIYSYNIPLTAEVMVFFKNTQPILSDANVRQALVMATNEQQIISSLGYPVIPANSPLLLNQLGYNSSLVQLTTNVAKANSVLTQDGWILGKDGIRYKNSQPLSFTLVTEDTDEYNSVASLLAQQYKAIGVELNVVSQASTDFQNTVSNRAYDTLLYGISIGVDPDVFVYWDSSQAAIGAVPGLNLSEYQSSTADSSLEQGRTRTNAALRAIKYQPFLQTWSSDAPAVALYQPRFLYITRGQIYNFSPSTINDPADRFSNVSNWEIKEIRTDNT